MFQRYLCFWLFICGSCVAEVPWGKDATLAFYEPCDPVSTSPDCIRCNPLADGGVYLIRFHQNVISPADGPRSNFLPSSSQYTLEAMQKYGFAKGVVYGCDRLMRENPDRWVYQTTLDGEGRAIKFDPVK